MTIELNKNLLKLSKLAGKAMSKHGYNQGIYPIPIEGEMGKMIFNLKKKCIVIT